MGRRKCTEKTSSSTSWPREKEQAGAGNDHYSEQQYKPRLDGVVIVPRRRYYPSADCRYSGPASVHPAVVSRDEVADTLKSIRRTVLYGINA
jgi:hypothetical protein